VARAQRERLPRAAASSTEIREIFSPAPRGD